MKRLDGVCFAYAAEQPIDHIPLSGQFSEDSKTIMAKGYIPRWSEAIGGIGNIVDEDGKAQHIKIFAVPFVNDIAGITGSIIGGFIQSEDGKPIHKFITEAAISAEIANARIIPAADISIKQTIGNPAEIWNTIIRSMDIKAPIPGIAIKKTFESSGYSDASIPAWFPRNGIWYAAICTLATR